MNMTSFRIGENDVALNDIGILNQLMKQLSPEAPTLSIVDVMEVMWAGTIITIRDISRGGALVGVGTLISIRKLFSICGTIEDVVVDELYRGQGLGKKIMMELVQRSKSLGMKFVDLTSNPKRVEANKLYQSMGFKVRETNLYRLYN